AAAARGESTGVTSAQAGAMASGVAGGNAPRPAALGSNPNAPGASPTGAKAAPDTTTGVGATAQRAGSADAATASATTAPKTPASPLPPGLDVDNLRPDKDPAITSDPDFDVSSTFDVP